MTVPGLKPYPVYKPSGVEWLGDVPAHWEVRRMKTLSSVKRGASPRPIDDPKYFDDGGEYAWVRIADVTASDHYLENTTQRLSPLGQSLSVRLQPGELFLSIAGSVGKPIITRIKCCIHDGFVYFPQFRGNVEFMYRLFSCRAMFAGLGKLGTQLNLNTETVGGIYLGWPPPKEQATIAHFLDRMDSQVTHYIAAKERLVKLLEEYRQTLIHDAVTGQVDVRTGQPYPAYKPSGVEWLGDVPAHWEVRRLRNVSRVLFSNVDKHSRDYETSIWLCNYSDVYHHDRIRTGMKFMKATATSKEIERFRLVADDVLITKDSEAWNDIGVPALVTETNGEVVCGYHLAILRPLPNVVMGTFLYHLLLCKGVSNQFYVRANGVTRFGLSQSAVRSIRMPLPPLSEQVAIARYLAHADRRLQTCIQSSQQQIELLKEFRTCLIADVVTGKLDVRDEASSLPRVDSIAGNNVGDVPGDFGVTGAEARQGD